MNLLKTASNIGIVYFTLFSIFYIIKFGSAWLLFVEFHSTITHVDIAQTITGSSPVFTVLALLAVIGAGIWIYQNLWGDRPATVS